MDEFNEGILPPGAVWEPGWGTIEHIAEEVGNLHLQATNPFMTDIIGSEKAISTHPASPSSQAAAHRISPNSPISRPPKLKNRVQSPQERPLSPDYEFRLPTIQSPNNLPGSLPRYSTTDRLSFGPPVYLSKRIKQLEIEKQAKEEARQQFIQALESDGYSLGSLSQSLGGRDGQSSNEILRRQKGAITVPPRVADVLPYQPEQANTQNRAVASRRGTATSTNGQGIHPLAGRLSPGGVVLVNVLQHQQQHYTPKVSVDGLGASLSMNNLRPKQDHVPNGNELLVSLSQTSLFS